MSTFGNDRYYTSAGDIFSVLRTLQTDRSSINIQFDQSNAPFSSMVLDVNLHAREFYLDEFANSQARKWAVSGRPFSLRASIHGIRVHAKDLIVLESATTRHGQESYRVAFPERLLYLQRRDAYRAIVPATLNAQIEMMRELPVKTAGSSKEQTDDLDKSAQKPIIETVSARIADMSATGLALEVDGPLQHEARMMELVSLQGNLPLIEQLLQVKAHLVYTRYLTDSDKTICGMKFSDLPRSQEVLITRFVTQLQRESISKKPA